MHHGVGVIGALPLQSMADFRRPLCTGCAFLVHFLLFSLVSIDGRELCRRTLSPPSRGMLCMLRDASTPELIAFSRESQMSSWPTDMKRTLARVYVKYGCAWWGINYGQVPLPNAAQLQASELEAMTGITNAHLIRVILGRNDDETLSANSPVTAKRAVNKSIQEQAAEGAGSATQLTRAAARDIAGRVFALLSVRVQKGKEAFLDSLETWQGAAPPAISAPVRGQKGERRNPRWTARVRDRQNRRRVHDASCSCVIPVAEVTCGGAEGAPGPVTRSRSGMRSRATRGAAGDGRRPKQADKGGARRKTGGGLKGMGAQGGVRKETGGGLNGMTEKTVRSTAARGLIGKQRVSAVKGTGGRRRMSSALVVWIKQELDSLTCVAETEPAVQTMAREVIRTEGRAEGKAQGAVIKEDIELRIGAIGTEGAPQTGGPRRKRPDVEAGPDASEFTPRRRGPGQSAKEEGIEDDGFVDTGEPFGRHFRLRAHTRILPSK